MSSGEGAAPGPWTMSAPESLVLLAADGRAPRDSDLLRAGLVDAVVRGCLTVDRRRVPGVVRERDEWLVTSGPHLDRLSAALAPFLAALEVAEQVADVGGRPGHRVPAVLTAVSHDLAGETFADRDVLPALEAAGLVTDVRAAKWFRTSRFTLTDHGAHAAQDAQARLAATREAVARAGGGHGRRDDRLTAAVAFGAAGALVAAEQDLLRAAPPIRRSLAADGNGDLLVIVAAGAAARHDNELSWPSGWVADLTDGRMDDVLAAVAAGAFDPAGSGARGITDAVGDNGAGAP